MTLEYFLSNVSKYYVKDAIASFNRKYTESNIEITFLRLNAGKNYGFTTSSDAYFDVRTVIPTDEDNLYLVHTFIFRGKRRVDYAALLTCSEDLERFFSEIYECKTRTPRQMANAMILELLVTADKYMSVAHAWMDYHVIDARVFKDNGNNNDIIITFDFCASEDHAISALEAIGYEYNDPGAIVPSSNSCKISFMECVCGGISWIMHTKEVKFV